jgi:hypothetical protein
MPAMLARMERPDILFFDGTLFRDDETITTGTGAKTGRRMGTCRSTARMAHWPPSRGPELFWLRSIRPENRIFVAASGCNDVRTTGILTYPRKLGEA